MKYLVLTLSIIISGFTIAQGDDCFNATSLGALPTPVDCSSGLNPGIGSTITQSGTTVGSTPGNPYVYMTDCGTGTVDMSTGSNDVWYSFEATGTVVEISLTGVMPNTNIGLWTGNCLNLSGIGCVIGDGAGNVSLTQFEALAPGQTYFLQISGNSPGTSANFTLNINNNIDCNDCYQGGSLVANPPPINGVYSAGQDVEFCFTLTDYNQVNINWLHGIQVEWSAGWQTTTSNVVTVPPPSGSGSGVWTWYPNGIGFVNGTNWPSGFYYDHFSVPGWGESNAEAYDLEFCWTLTTLDPISCSSSIPLSVSVNTSADGESGSWTSIACGNDPTITFEGVLSCCSVAPDITSTDLTCSGTPDGTATVTSQGTISPWTYQWYDENGTLISTITNSTSSTNTLSNLSPGSYTVVVTDFAGCSSGNTVIVNDFVSSAPSLSSTNADCSGTINDGTATVVSNGTPGPWTFMWFDSAGNMVSSTTNSGSNTNTINNLGSGTYTVTITDGANCNSSGSVTVGLSAFSTPTFNQVGPVCVGEPFSLPTTSNEGITGSWSPAPDNTTTIEYTFTPDPGQCSNTTTMIVPVKPAPSVTISGAGVICSGSTIDLIANLDGIDPSVTWSSSDGSFSSTTATLTTFTPSVTSGSVFITATVTSPACSLPADETIELTVVSSITPEFDSVDPICTGNTFTLPSTSNNGITGTWSPAIDNTITTTYTFTPDAGQCATTIDLTVVVIPNPADPIVSTGAATCTADGTATIDNYDGTLTYTFTPAGPTVGAGGVISSMTPGTSYDVVANNGSCSSGAATFSVDPQLTVPVDPIVSTGAATCTADGTATIDNYDGTLTYTFTPAGPTVGAGGVISSMTPGTSYDVVADDGSCSSGPATFSVDPQLTVPADPIVSTGAATCTADGTATIDNYDGTLTYTFTPAGPTVGAGGVISGLTPGTSYDVVADNGSCSSGPATFSVDPQLTVPADPIVSTGAATCTADGTATIDNYDGTLTYTFTPAGPTVGAGGVISGMTPGTSYDVVADDGSCSSGPATFSVDPQLTVPADPIVSTGAATCTADGTATIDNYDGTLTYTFTPAGPTVGAGGVISGMTPGTSYDVVADNGSCSSGPATFSVDPQLTVPADPIVSTGAATCTADGTATIDNYDGTLTYTFTPAGPTAGAGGVISGMTPGTSYDVVADDGSCSSGPATFSVDPQLTVPADPIVSTGAATCTADGTATIDNYDGTLTYTFTPAGPTAGASGVISGMTPGTSYDVVADDGSCSSGPATFSVDPQLTVPADPIVSTGAATCTADGTATIDNYDGTLTYTFTPAGPTVGAGGVISGLTPGTSYDVVADDGSCSSGPATFSVDPQLPTPTISLTPNDPSECNEIDGSILVGGIGSGTVTWSGPASGNDNTAVLNYTIPNLGAGSYDVFFIDGTTGCQSTTESAELNNPGAPSLDALSSTTACDTYTLPAITGTNLSGNQSYYTESNGAGTPLSEGDVISSTQTIYIYDILGTCADESNFTITIDYTPSLTNPGPQEGCESFNLPLTIDGTNLSGNENYYSDLQSNGGILITNAITSSQTVYIYDANGNCSNEISFEVTVNPLPSLVSFTGEGTYCEGDDVNNLIVEVSGAPDYTLDYTLNGNPTTISSSNSSIDLGNASGTYVLTALADNACGISLDQTQTITVNPLPSIPTVSEDASYCSNAVAEDLQASGSSGNYSWYSDASLSELIGSNQSYSPDMIMGTTTYYVTATENGCEGLPAEVSITFENCEIIIPTAFTPDDDQVNDTWNLGDIDVIYPNNVVSIYNRWGNKIYESDQGAYSQRPWNGTFNEQALPVASYYFIIEFNDNSTQNKTGIVSLIK